MDIDAVLKQIDTNEELIKVIDETIESGILPPWSGYTDVIKSWIYKARKYENVEVLFSITKLCIHYINIQQKNEERESLVNIYLLLNSFVELVNSWTNSNELIQISFWESIGEFQMNVLRICPDKLHCYLIDIGNILLKTTMKSSLPLFLRQLRIKSLNTLLEDSPAHIRVAFKEDIKSKLPALLSMLQEVGDYDYQTSIVETIFRLTLSEEREESIADWFPNLDNSVRYLFTKIFDFDPDCRNFLNTYNKHLGKKCQVYSITGISAKIGNYELKKPKHPLYECFWIDFNLGSKTISLLFDHADPDVPTQERIWETIMVYSSEVDRALLEVRPDICSLVLNLNKNPSAFFATPLEQNVVQQLNSDFTIEFNSNNKLEYLCSRMFQSRLKVCHYGDVEENSFKKSSISNNIIVVEGDSTLIGKDMNKISDSICKILHKTSENIISDSEFIPGTYTDEEQTESKSGWSITSKDRKDKPKEQEICYDAIPSENAKLQSERKSVINTRKHDKNQTASKCVEVTIKPDQNTSKHVKSAPKSVQNTFKPLHSTPKSFLNTSKVEKRDFSKDKTQCTSINRKSTMETVMVCSKDGITDNISDNIQDTNKSLISEDEWNNNNVSCMEINYKNVTLHSEMGKLQNTPKTNDLGDISNSVVDDNTQWRSEDNVVSKNGIKPTEIGIKELNSNSNIINTNEDINDCIENKIIPADDNENKLSTPLITTLNILSKYPTLRKELKTPPRRSVQRKVPKSCPSKYEAPKSPYLNTHKSISKSRNSKTRKNLYNTNTPKLFNKQPEKESIEISEIPIIDKHIDSLAEENDNFPADEIQKKISVKKISIKLDGKRKKLKRKRNLKCRVNNDVSFSSDSALDHHQPCKKAKYIKKSRIYGKNKCSTPIPHDGKSNHELNTISIYSDFSLDEDDYNWLNVRSTSKAVSNKRRSNNNKTYSGRSSKSFKTQSHEKKRHTSVNPISKSKADVNISSDENVGERRVTRGYAKKLSKNKSSPNFEQSILRNISPEILRNKSANKFNSVDEHLSFQDDFSLVPDGGFKKCIQKLSDISKDLNDDDNNDRLEKIISPDEISFDSRVSLNDNAVFVDPGKSESLIESLLCIRDRNFIEMEIENEDDVPSARIRYVQEGNSSFGNNVMNVCETLTESPCLNGNVPAALNFDKSPEMKQCNESENMLEHSCNATPINDSIKKCCSQNNNTEMITTAETSRYSSLSKEFSSFHPLDHVEHNIDLGAPQPQNQTINTKFCKLKDVTPCLPNKKYETPKIKQKKLFPANSGTSPSVIMLVIDEINIVRKQARELDRRCQLISDVLIDLFQRK